MRAGTPAKSSDENWSFDWGDIRGEVASLGGMLGPVWFRLASGREIQPFAVAPWSDDTAEKLEKLPPILRRLRGEWPCVPFGMPETRTDLPARWTQGIDASKPVADAFAHGFSANHNWHLVAREAERITIAIDYPAEHPVRRLERCVSRGEGLAIDISLKIEMRRDAELPLGLHPVFALPDMAGAAQISLPSLQLARTFPVDVEPSISVLQPDQTNDSLRSFRTKKGSLLDCSQLPWEVDTEELVLATVKTGEARLANRADNYEVQLNWDAAVFPHCLLWFSNHGRTAYPWNGRFCAVGIEPVAAAFDLGEVHSANPNSPVAKSGTRTSVKLKAETPFVTRYQIGIRNPPNLG